MLKIHEINIKIILKSYKTTYFQNYDEYSRTSNSKQHIRNDRIRKITNQVMSYRSSYKYILKMVQQT